MCAQIGLGIAFGVYKQPVQDAIIRELRVWEGGYSAVDTYLNLSDGTLKINGPTKLRVPQNSGGGSLLNDTEILATNGLNSLQMWVSTSRSVFNFMLKNRGGDNGT